MLRRWYCSEELRQRRSYSRSEENIQHLWAHQLKMNPTKSFLGVASGKFLEFIMTSQGIHLDLEKVRTIQEMQPPRNLRELRGLQGRPTYIWSFISNLSGRCQFFTNLMKEFHLFGTMLAKKRSRKSNNTSRIHPSAQLQCQENPSWYTFEVWIIL